MLYYIYIISLSYIVLHFILCRLVRNWPVFLPSKTFTWGNPDDFQKAIDRMREKWESKKMRRDQSWPKVRIDGAMEGMRSSKTCMFQFGRRHTCVTREVERCHVSLWVCKGWFWNLCLQKGWLWWCNFLTSCVRDQSSDMFLQPEEAWQAECRIVHLHTIAKYYPLRRELP